MNNTGANTSQHVGGASVPKHIRFEPGTLKETKINICSYEMFEMEMLDRSLVSLQRTEEAYVDINNRIIESVNKRKDRLNGINNRVLNLSQKVLALYNANTAMRIMSPSQYPQIQSTDLTQHHPHTSIFFETEQVLRNKSKEQQNDFPELSSLRLDKKLFNNRLQNDPENLKKIVSGVTKDIGDISSLILSLERYRSTINDFKHDLTKQSNQVREQSEGLLGRIPEKTQSIAELLLFDSDINVYGDSNVYLPEFDYKTRSRKRTDDKRKTLQQTKQKQLLLKKQQEKKKAALTQLAEAPISVAKRGGDKQTAFRQKDEIGFRPDYKPAPKINFNTNLEGIGFAVADISDHDKAIVQHEQKKNERQNTANLTMTQGQIHDQSMHTAMNLTNPTGLRAQSTNYFDGQIVSQMDQGSRGTVTSMYEDIAPTKKVKEQEEEIKRHMEEQQRAKLQMDQEEAHENFDNSQMDPSENAKTIPIDHLFKKKKNQFVKGQQQALSRTMTQEVQNQPLVTLATTIDTNTQNQLAYKSSTTLAPQSQQQPPTSQPQMNNISSPPGPPTKVGAAGGGGGPPPPPPMSGFLDHLAQQKKGVLPPPPGNPSALPSKEGVPQQNKVPPPSLLNAKTNVKPEFDGGSPISSRNNLPPLDNNDQSLLLDDSFEDASLSYMQRDKQDSGQSRLQHNQNLADPRSMTNSQIQPSPQALQNLKETDMSSSQIRQSQKSPGKKPLPPPKEPPMSFTDLIKKQSSNLVKQGTKLIPQKKEFKETSNPNTLNRRVSNMDSLKEQIMLRKQALNPDSKQKKGGNDNDADLAKKSNLMSKFAVISDNEDDEHSEASDSGSDYD